MVETTDKLGQTVYITMTDDPEGGYYCETYADENCDRKIDDFYVPASICSQRTPWMHVRYDNVEEIVENYCRHHYDDEVLDLNWKF